MLAIERRRVYTVNEAAEILQFHPDTVRYWLRVGELPGVLDVTQNEWRIVPDDLIAFLRQSGETLPASLRPAS